MHNFSRWKEIVEQAFTWPLLCRGAYRWFSAGSQPTPTNRKFHKITIFNDVKKKEIIEKLQVHGDFVLELALYYDTLTDSNNLLKYSYLMPNLKKIVLYATNKGKTLKIPTENNAPCFAKLKTLEMVMSNYALFGWFKNTQLDTLKILDSKFPERLSRRDLMEFLSTQKNLTTLALRSISSSMLFQTPMDCNVQFRLKKISLQGFELKESEHNNLLEFLNIHALTIEELEMTGKFPEFVYENVFAKFKNLKKLKIIGFPKGDDFYGRLDKNLSITSLTLDGFEPPESPKFFQTMPNIENLKWLSSCSKKTLQLIGNNFTQLNNLSIGNLSTDAGAGDLQFPSLNVVKVKNFDKAFDWDSFTKAVAPLSELCIISYTELTNRNIEDISHNLENLHTLRLDCKIVGDKEFFDIIRRNCKKLKSLHLEQKSLKTDASDVIDIRGLTLGSKFTEDIASDDTWNEDDYGAVLPEEDHNWARNSFDDYSS